MASKNSSASKPAFQLGRTLDPAQILTCAAGVYDADKANISCKILLTDLDSLEHIRQLEAASQAAHPELLLNSTIQDDAVLHPDTGTAGYVVRIKMSRNPRCYRATNPWTTGAAPTMNLLDYGHTVLLQCREQEWVYQAGCGITIYANLIRGVGAVAVPWGLTPPAPDVEWL
jgi:hypothetical protein